MNEMIEQQLQVVNSSINLLNLKNKTVYDKRECAWFFSKNDHNWLLSNMAGQMPIYFPKGKKWNSAEQLYQASKYSPGTICLPVATTDKGTVEPDVRKRIEAATNARGAKMT